MTNNLQNIFDAIIRWERFVEPTKHEQIKKDRADYIDRLTSYLLYEASSLDEGQRVLLVIRAYEDGGFDAELVRKKLVA